MSDHTIGENINRLLKLHGDLSISDLARETKIPQPTLHHIIDGKTKKPRAFALEALASFFSISIPQLTGAIPLTTNIPDMLKDSLKISTVPLIDWDSAKHWNTDNHKTSGFDEIILDKQVDKNVFAVQLQSSDMEPMFQENSILILDPSKQPKERDFVLVYLPDQDRLIFNRLFIEGNIYYIKQNKSDGNAELTKINSPKDKIIATLIEARLKF